MLKEKILDLVRRERELEAGKGCALPEKCYFLSDGVMLCYPRATGDSRYPYAAGGFTLWAYSSGYITLNESTFYFIPPAAEGNQPYAAFFGGIKKGDKYFPVSVTGTARRADEPGVKRYMVYAPEAAYYIAEADGAVFYLVATVTDKKQAVLSLGAINTGAPKDITLSTYLNCLIMHAPGENVETKWFKKCTATDSGYLFESVENLDRTTKLFNYGVINRAVTGTPEYFEHTSARAGFSGGITAAIASSPVLSSGHLEKQKPVCIFGETAAAGDVCAFSLDHDGEARIDYVLETPADLQSARAAVRDIPASLAEDNLAARIAGIKMREASPTALDIKLTGTDMDDGTLNMFIANVLRQVEFCALATNSGVSLLGVRDVAQQIEAALMWKPRECRSKIIELLGFIDPSGRPPRQYSLPAKGALPAMDTREFIDQGVWIISMMYTYLAFTGDYSILDERCGYYKIVGRNRVEACDESDTVAEHIARIAGYLISNLDGETGCLRALYGDWNDALDGLGVTDEPGKEYGSGVSVMASLQLYKNLEELAEIISVYGDRYGNGKKYAEARKKLEKGLLRYAVVKKGGERKVLHGWGDKRAYLVGSFCDADGMSRDGLAANAYWVLSGAYLLDKSIKKDILASYARLDSKYGLRTFEPYFAPDAKGVGRIVDLPRGTAENGAVYVHATVFGARSLFALGEGEAAWTQIKKILPITHSLITTTPFVMSNSFVYNEELGLDGESMSDWFTGSSNALVKALVWDMFGVKPDLSGLLLSPSDYFPCDSAELGLSVRGKKIKIVYKKTGAARAVEIDGTPVPTVPHPSSAAPAVYIPEAELKDGMVITVTD